MFLKFTNHLQRNISNSKTKSCTAATNDWVRAKVKVAYLEIAIATIKSIRQYQYYYHDDADAEAEADDDADADQHYGC